MNRIAVNPKKGKHMSIKNRANTDHYSDHGREEMTSAFNFGASKSKGAPKTDVQDNGEIPNVPKPSEMSRRPTPKGPGNRPM